MLHGKDIQISILHFFWTNFPLYYHSAIYRIYCLVLLKASMHCAWDLPQCCLQR